MRKRIISLFLAVGILSSLMLAFTSCGDITGKYKVEMKVVDFGTVVIELDADAAPKTVKNFLNLVNDGFYDGLTFHRVMPDFMIQGGDPKADGTGSSGKTIKGEFSQNGYNNPISHKRGVISMARGEDMDSASCQFFICNADSTFLDGMYAAFGTVIEGMDVIDAITEETAPYNYNFVNGMIKNKEDQAVIEYIKAIE